MDVNRMIRTKSKLTRKGEDKEVRRSILAKEGQLSKKENDGKYSVKKVTIKGHNKLSFVIVVKGREGLGVAINAKGGL